MGLFEKIFGLRKEREYVREYFKTLTAYQPTFRRWSGKLYESDVIRQSIDAIARHVSKLEIKIDGAAQPKIQTILKKRPNQYQTWSQFLYRMTTILMMQNNCFIVPILNKDLTIAGLWTCLPSRCAIKVDKRGVEWLEYKFSTGETGYVELSRCGLLTRHQYESDFFGENNDALDETLDLIDLERQGVKEGIKSAANIRFMARLTNFKDPEDMAIEQRNFTTRNLSSDSGGFLLFPNTYDNIQQISSKAYVVDPKTQELIRSNVYNYFGVNEKVINNSASGVELDAFFEGMIEPLSIQLSEVLSFMLFSDLEIAHGARVHAAANRLQYMSTADKISFISALSDRGFITINEGRELLNYTPLPDEIGDKLPIRGEFKFVGEDREPIALPAAEETTDDDTE